jgi:hypothetical protein
VEFCNGADGVNVARVFAASEETIPLTAPWPLTVNVVEFTVDEFIGLLNVITIGADTATFVAPFGGVDAFTTGGVSSRTVNEDA